MQEKSYIVSARKYRPADFNDVIGQKAITDTLDRAIASGRLAQALLFCGPRGVGKTTCARILAKKINGFYQGSFDNISNDLNIFELDAASNNSVDDIRTLIDQLRFAPQKGKYKVYIIDEVHMLSQAAFNAFLKTLEEPPLHAIFVLATTERHKVLPTILSRCQVYEFRRISLEDIYRQLKKIAKAEGIIAEQEAFHMIAQHADGALRDALSIFDRLICFSGKNLTAAQVREQLGILDREYYFKSLELIIARDVRGILMLFNRVLQEGFDGALFIAGLADHLRHLMVASDPRSLSLIEMPENMQAKYVEQSCYVSVDFLSKALQICQRAEIDCKLSRNPRLFLEIFLIQLASSINTGIESEKKNKTSSSAVPQGAQPDPIKPKNPTASHNLSSYREDNLVKKEFFPSPSNPVAVETNDKVFVEKSKLGSFSIREALKESTPAESSTVEIPRAKEVYTKEDFTRVWEEFSKDPIVAKSTSLKHVLGALEYEVCQDNSVVLYFSSKAALAEFSTVSESALKYIRSHLNNFYICFKTFVKDFYEKKTVYTPEEKFAFLKKKNPQVEKLKEHLDLDFYD